MNMSYLNGGKPCRTEEHCCKSTRWTCSTKLMQLEIHRTVRLNLTPWNTCPCDTRERPKASVIERALTGAEEKSQGKRTPKQDAAACVESTENWSNSTKAKKLGCRRGTQAPMLTGRMCTQARADSLGSSASRILRRRRGRSGSGSRGLRGRRRRVAYSIFNSGYFLYKRISFQPLAEKSSSRIRQ